MTQLALPHLALQDSVAVVRSVLPTAQRFDRLEQEIVEKAAGNPFFLEELARALVECDELHATLPIPDTIQAVLAARIDRLQPTDKRLLQIAAVIGKDVFLPLLDAVAEFSSEAFDQSLGALQSAEFLYAKRLVPESVYSFKHILIQEVAYQSLLTSTRQQLHQRIAQALCERFPETAVTQPALLARHYTEAGLSEQAVTWWHKAGRSASERSAYVEALSNLRMGLDILTPQPDTPERAQRELDLLTMLGPALMATKGYAAPEVGETYTRAQQLAQQIGARAQLFAVLRGLRSFHVLRGELQVARELGQQLLQLAQSTLDSARLMEAHHALGVALVWLGEFTAARRHLEQALTFCDLQQRHSDQFHTRVQDIQVACLSHMAHILWYLGYPDQALRKDDEALSLARELSHPFSLAHALYFSARLRQLRREVLRTQEAAEETVALSTEQGFAFWLAHGMNMQGWAWEAQGQQAKGLTQMRQGLEAVSATGAELLGPYLRALLAEACGKAGQVPEGLHQLAEAMVMMHKHEGRWCAAELYRLKGELLQQTERDRQHAESTPEACFLQALDTAHQQQAKSWELRAAMSLSRLWQRHGKAEEARRLLAKIYGQFTEGFDTADLQDAKALLEEMA